VNLIVAQTVIPDFGGGENSCVRKNSGFCWNWVQDNWSDVLWPAVKQHVALTAIAVVIGFVIAFALALLAHRRRGFEAPTTVITGILYTIPSLALFQILVGFSFLGLNRLTVEIALVSYTLLILYRNILEGLRGVPAEVRESARGMGLTRLQSLVRVELPLAVPSIMAGLRIATVSTISIATIAAFVIPEGLGRPIFIGIGQDVFKTEIIAAGGLAILLALAADALLVLLGRVLTPWRTA